ncbi:MAG: ImmA/IrrE family metallo-endopeptidase, partial [Flavobacterium sp.]
MLSRSSTTAIQLLKSYCIDDPNEIPLEDLIYAEGGIFEEKEMTGADGRIIFGKEYASVSINSKIQNKSKRRFVIAHEIGHLKLHRKLAKFFNCDEKSFMEWHQKGSHETEANEFAAELLMPSSLFKDISSRETFSVKHLLNVSKLFNTSVTSTAIRYAEIGKFPIALFYCQDSRIAWYRVNSHFLCKFPRVKEDVASNSVAFDFFKTGNVKEDPSLVLPKIWFKDIQLKSDQYFFEQCFPIPSLNAVISFV